MQAAVYAALIVSAAAAGKNARVSLRLRPTALRGVIRLRLFGLIPLSWDFSLALIYPYGPVFRFGGMRPRVFGKSGRGGGPARALLRSVKVFSIALSGAVGVASRPDLTALTVGAINVIFSSVAALLRPESASADVRPFFNENAFALNVEGIIGVSAAKIIKEALKKENKK